jgi:hypothetical protein
LGVGVFARFELSQEKLLVSSSEFRVQSSKFKVWKSCWLGKDSGSGLGKKVGSRSIQLQLAIVVFSESTHDKRAAERCAFMVFCRVENGK